MKINRALSTNVGAQTWIVSMKLAIFYLSARSTDQCPLALQRPYPPVQI
jgi:hypothetical protein